MLVIETTNFTDQTRFRGSSKDLKVTERFTRDEGNYAIEDILRGARKLEAEASGKK